MEKNIQRSNPHFCSRQSSWWLCSGLYFVFERAPFWCDVNCWRLGFGSWVVRGRSSRDRSEFGCWRQSRWGQGRWTGSIHDWAKRSLLGTVVNSRVKRMLIMFLRAIMVLLLERGDKRPKLNSRSLTWAPATWVWSTLLKRQPESFTLRMRTVKIRTLSWRWHGSVRSTVQPKEDTKRSRKIFWRRLKEQRKKHWREKTKRKRKVRSPMTAKGWKSSKIMYCTVRCLNWPELYFGAISFVVFRYPCDMQVHWSGCYFLLPRSDDKVASAGSQVYRFGSALPYASPIPT